MILLALAKLAIERPGWDNALSDIARLMDGNLAMYNEMKKTAELGVLSDPVPDLKSITVEQRLGAAILHYGHGDRIGFTSGLEHALELLRPDGWKHIAPAWLRLKPSDNPGIPDVEPPDLKDTTPEQRVRAAAVYYRRKGYQADFASGLDHALLIMQPNGWEHIAPAWLRLRPRKRPMGVRRVASASPGLNSGDLMQAMCSGPNQPGSVA